MEMRMKKFLVPGILAAALTFCQPAQAKSVAVQSSGGNNAAPGSIQTGNEPSNADPFQEMAQMQSRMLQMLKGLMASDFMGSTSPAGAFSGPALQPDFDVIEENNAYVVKMDAPGMNKDKIDIQVKNDILNVTAEREQIEQENGSNQNVHYYYRGRSFGTFQRSLHIPENVKTEDISAKYENGVLTITLPKAQQKAPGVQKIKVA